MDRAPGGHRAVAEAAFGAVFRGRRLFPALLALLSFCALLVLPRPSSIASPSGRPLLAEGGAPERGQAPESLRRRWEQLDPETKEDIREIFRRINKLTPAERQRLFDRLRARSESERRELIRRARRSVDQPTVDRRVAIERQRLLRRQLAQLSAKERERLRGLRPEERAAELRRLFQDRRRQFIEKLPPAVRQEIAELAPREQAARLRKYQAEQAARRTFRDPREVEALRRLPRARVIRALLPLKGHDPSRRPPPFLSRETWARWHELRPFERPRVLRHVLAPPRRASSRDRSGADAEADGKVRAGRDGVGDTPSPRRRSRAGPEEKQGTPLRSRSPSDSSRNGSAATGRSGPEGR